MADCVSWLSTVAQDRAWLAETAALEWNEDDDATEGEEDEDEQGDEAVVVAAAVCAYELEGETWADLGGGEWTTLYLVEERRRCSLSLRVAALDQTSQDGQQELAVASAMMADGALVLDDVDDPTFGELSCGTVDGDEIAVYGLRFATVDAALSFQASLKDACLRMHAGERPSENDSTSDASAHAIATVQPSPTPSLRVILPTPVPVLAPAAHSPAPASPATPAPAPPSPPRRAAVSDDAAAVAEETAAHLEASASMRLELQAMGFEGSQIDASLSALQAASAEAHVDWILEHASAIVAPVDEFDAEASPLFSFESAENTAWSLVEEAANATLTACAFDASSPNDSDRAQRAARSAAACARALLDGDELSTASKTFRDAWWRGVAQRATVVPQGEARPELRQAAQAIGRHIRSEVYARCTGAADDGADYAKGAGEEKSTEPADAARLLDEPVPPRGTGTRPTSGGSTSSTASNHNARLRDLAAAAARATSEVARRQAAKSPRKRGPLIGAFLRMTRSTSARTPARRIATPHYAPPPAPGPPPEPRDVRPSQEFVLPPPPARSSSDGSFEEDSPEGPRPSEMGIVRV
ncbi:hypothetical protein M885DRAFT_521656 [Pelagophyceae sp. CCMP2097]|nr:hypothetical protein M885DRAFT_521656 [Pelagophyceae sp. CCMP2097]